MKLGMLFNGSGTFEVPSSDRLSLSLVFFLSLSWQVQYLSFSHSLRFFPVVRGLSLALVVFVYVKIVFSKQFQVLVSLWSNVHL